MSFEVDQVEVSEYPELVSVWEASVRATHDFLSQGDIEYFKPLILNQYLGLVKLACVRSKEEKAILGFIGIADQKVEMLFVHPKAMGRGIGKLLMKYAIENVEATKVDVNEDNMAAVGFYKHLGFEVKSRSEFDPMGKPYPILHMQLGR
ncbi:GNAT family N-acetyltransferase [Echinicola sp. CAU 1574]|uniref:GNAT family N-acetyltransferase n=1 Tax=Echinicola arenosa TaxID=2774144 RepID=A0ABR9AHH0_9BACT|nr:GNAT family N-acetyltransferase [Echinicola arenosa]MBD8487731.1 GNAT family N-acetyltransferase [Echinicola arenosa]